MDFCTSTSLLKTYRIRLLSGDWREKAPGFHIKCVCVFCRCQALADLFSFDFVGDIDVDVDLENCAHNFNETLESR